MLTSTQLILVESVPPNVNSPFWFDYEFVGSNYEDEVKFDSSLTVEVVCDCGNEVILTRSAKSQATRSDPKTDSVSAASKG